MDEPKGYCTHCNDPCPRCSPDEEQEPPDIGTMTDEEVNAQLRLVMSQEEIDGFVKSTKALVRVCIDNRELRAEIERLKAQLERIRETAKHIHREYDSFNDGPDQRDVIDSNWDAFEKALKP